MIKKEKNNETNSKTCFVISPIGEPKSETRSRADRLFKYIITPAVKILGYIPIRADQISEPGIITNQIIENVVESDLVIADLTGHNPNVFYELAIRHSIKKKYIQLIQIGESLPFDIKVTRTIQYDLQDLDNVDKVKNELSSSIIKLQKSNKPIDTPISVTLDLKAFRESGKPIEKSLANIIQMISDINNKISSTEQQLFSKEPIGISGMGGLGWFATKGNIYDDKTPKKLIREYDSVRNRYIWIEKDDKDKIKYNAFNFPIDKKYKLPKGLDTKDTEDNDESEI